MRYTKDRCLSCGTPQRRHALDSKYSNLDETGRVTFTQYWFCSEECYEKEISKYLEKEYGFDVKADGGHPYFKELFNKVCDEHNGDYLVDNSPEDLAFRQNFQNRWAEFAKTWNQIKVLSISVAERSLIMRIQAEWEHNDSAEREKEIKELDDSIEADKLAYAAYEAKMLLEKPHDLSAEPITDEHRFEHTLIVAASGGGKTTLMENQILEFLQRPNPPGIIVIDPKSLLIARIQKLALFDPDNGRLRDRIVIIDPSHTPALNMFDSRGFPINENQLVDIYQYMFASKDNAITPKMTTMFTFLVRLLSTIPQATIHDLLDLCDDRARSLDESKFASKIRQLDRTAIRFFENDYYGAKSDYGSTRDQVKQRLYNILGVREIDAAFSHPHRAIDMFEALQKRKIVLVNADIDLLGEDGCQLWGRAILGLTLAATYARGKIPKSQWHEAFVFMDEAQLFVDEEKTPRFLQLAREYRVGITHAMQDLSSSLTGKLQAAMSTNTSIKYAASVEADDLKYVSNGLRCDPEFIKAQRKTSAHAVFACFVRNLMRNPASVSVPWQPLTREPQMTEQQHQRMIDRNRALFSVDGAKQKPPLEAASRPSAEGATNMSRPLSGTHEGSTEAEPARVNANIVQPAEAKILKTAEADKPTPPQKEADPSKPSKWKRGADHYR